jgi:tRNA(adenine34) deaminase
MMLAINEAVKASNKNEVPVGAVIVKGNEIVGSGHNRVLENMSVAAHAEIMAINSASQKLNNYRLIDCDLYVTLEPCHMCAKAIIDARIKTLYFAAPEPKTGSIISIDNFLDKEYLNHRTNYKSGLKQDESSKIMRDFFVKRR